MKSRSVMPALGCLLFLATCTPGPNTSASRPGLGTAAVPAAGLISDAQDKAADGGPPGTKTTPEAEAIPAREAPSSGSAGNHQTASFTKAIAAFGVDLYRQLGSSRKGNAVIAPASVSLALAMTWSGARGQTAQEMAKVCHLSGERSQLASSARGLMLSLDYQDEGAGTLRVGNGLFVQATCEPKPEFLDGVRHQFSGSVEALDFQGQTESARLTINLRMAEQTERHIQEVLPRGSLKPTTRLVVTNAVFFRGEWRSPFDAKATGQRVFYTDGQAAQKVPMMTTESDFNHAAVNNVQIVELPYKGDALSMLVVLPNERAGLGEVEAQLTVERLDGWITALARKRVVAMLPRFELRAATRLKEPLRALGMVLAFDPGRADFGGMTTDDNVSLDDVYHQVFVRVDEKGTEATAATAAVVQAVSATKSIDFIADHPFLFVIRHRASGALLFVGRVVAPADAA